MSHTIHLFTFYITFLIIKHIIGIIIIIISNIIIYNIMN